MKETVLDNPAWEALNTLHANFAQGTENAKRYRPGILPFVGCSGAGRADIEALNECIIAGETFYIIGDDLPLLPGSWTVEQELACAQMLLRSAAIKHVSAVDQSGTLQQLGTAEAGEMFDLINTVQPGYYCQDSHLLGTYYGIKENGRLVAMAGERMRLTGFSELSAICTHAAYTGRGYAQKLITQLCSFHAAAGIVSFLHVALFNHRAIRLYQYMGFEQRRTIVFRRLKKKE